jgi:hypothetical protein
MLTRINSLPKFVGFQISLAFFSSMLQSSGEIDTLGKGESRDVLGVDPGIATIGFGLILVPGIEQSMLRCGVIHDTSWHSACLPAISDSKTILESLFVQFQPDCVPW